MMRLPPLDHTVIVANSTSIQWTNDLSIVLRIRLTLLSRWRVTDFIYTRLYRGLDQGPIRTFLWIVEDGTDIPRSEWHLSVEIFGIS